MVNNDRRFIRAIDHGQAAAVPISETAPTCQLTGPDSYQFLANVIERCGDRRTRPLTDVVSPRTSKLFLSLSFSLLAVTQRYRHR